MYIPKVLRFSWKFVFITKGGNIWISVILKLKIPLKIAFIIFLLVFEAVCIIAWTV